MTKTTLSPFLYEIHFIIGFTLESAGRTSTNRSPLGHPVTVNLSVSLCCYYMRFHSFRTSKFSFHNINCPSDCPTWLTGTPYDTMISLYTGELLRSPQW